MPLSIQPLFPPTVCTTAAVTIYTVPTGSVLQRGRMRFTNTTGGAITVTAYGVQAGGSAAASNAFLSAKSIAANDYLDSDIPVLGPLMFLQVLASAGASITVSQIDGIVFST